MKATQIILTAIIFVVLTGFSKCNSNKSVQDNPPVALGQAYFQKWVAGVQGGGSGLNLFIPIKETNLALDSVYFRGKVCKLELDVSNESIYIGRFYSDFNTKKNVVMSNKDKDEFGNELPDLPRNIPFNIGEDQCVVSYINENKTKYFIIKNIVEKQSIARPSAPSKNDN